MPELIRLEIPDSISECDFAAYLIANQAQFYLALNRRAKEHDIRSEVDEVLITDLKLELDRVTISYDVDFCFRHGCQDLEYADKHRRKVTAIRDGRTFIFEVDLPGDLRSTSDEL